MGELKSALEGINDVVNVQEEGMTGCSRPEPHTFEVGAGPQTLLTLALTCLAELEGTIAIGPCMVFDVPLKLALVGVAERLSVAF